MSDGVLSVVNSGKESEWEWIIENFSVSEESYVSPHFKFESESWWLGLLPNNTDGYICLSIFRSSPGSSIKVKFSVALKINEGTKSFERRGRKCFKRKGSVYEIREWIRTSEFSSRQREFLSSGCLTILFTMKKADSEESETATSTSEASVVRDQDKFFQDLRQLLLNQEHSDVILRVKGKEFPAHKAILSVRSPVFASTFRHEMKENKTGIVDIEDCDPSFFPDFLSFLYCNDTGNLSAENVFALFTISDKYDCQDLRAKCICFIKENLTVETFCKALHLALLHSDTASSETELLRAATDFFIKNVENILETVEWQAFVVENPLYSNELFIKYVKSIKQSNN